MSDVFNMTKNRIEDSKITKEIDCIKTIVLNISEYCNLKCAMCPRSKDYTNRKIFMNPWEALLIRLRLEEIDYSGVVSISGMGEPCYNPDLIKILETLTHISNDYIPKYKIKLLTNGTVDVDYKTISNMGIKILVSVHDISKLDYFKYKFADIPVVFRNHDPDSLNTELKVTNRAGYMEEDKSVTSKYVNNCCNYPFYKMIIDYDGSYLLCPEDWKRVTKKDKNNVRYKSIEEYFCKELLPIKKQLSKNGRKYLYPCKYCDIEGTLMGGNTVDWFKHRFRKI